MSMKDAIFGTAAPTSHGGATYRDSIQAWLPVKNIIGGVVITKDNRFIKILEVLPVNFYLKSPSDQQNIITSYAAYLKIAPDSMSCEVRTLPPDTSEYVEQMRQFQRNEESKIAARRSRTILKRSVSVSPASPSGIASFSCSSTKPRCAPSATPSRASFSA